MMFDRNDVETKQRAARLLAELEDKRSEIEALSQVREEYYRSTKDYLLVQFRSILEDEEDISPQAMNKLVLMAAHTMLMGISDFSLALAETIVFGKPQADIDTE